MKLYHCLLDGLETLYQRKGLLDENKLKARWTENNESQCTV